MRLIRNAFLLGVSMTIGGCAGAPPLPEFTVAHPASRDAPEAPIVARSSSLMTDEAATQSIPETSPATSTKPVDSAEKPMDGEHHGGQRR